jgi:hypothetical protein
MMTNKADARARARIIATRGALKADRMAGFRQTNSALDAILANTATTERGIAASQTVANARTVAALHRISGRASSRGSAIARATGKAERSQYGSVAGAAADRQSSALEASRAASQALQAGERGAGNVGVKGATDVLGIVRAGVKEAAAGAKGQLADALAYRARQDASVIANMQQARLQAQLEFKNWKRQQEYLAKQEQKDTSGALGGVRQAADTAGDAAVFFRQQMAENPGSSASDLVSAYHDKFGSLGGSEDPLLNILAGNVVKSTNEEGRTIDGYTREDDLHDTMRALSTLYPNFGKARPAVQKLILASFKAYDTARDADEKERAAQALDAATAQLTGKEVVGGTGTDRYVRTDVVGGTGTDRFQPAPDQLISKSGKPIHYVYGQPMYDSNGQIVPLEDRP